MNCSGITFRGGNLAAAVLAQAGTSVLVLITSRGSHTMSLFSWVVHRSNPPAGVPPARSRSERQALATEIGLPWPPATSLQVGRPSRETQWRNTLYDLIRSSRDVPPGLAPKPAVRAKEDVMSRVLALRLVYGKGL